MTAFPGISTPYDAPEESPDAEHEEVERLYRDRKALLMACKRLLESADWETGDEVEACWCTSSGNEERPGACDVICGACLARAAIAQAEGRS